MNTQIASLFVDDGLKLKLEEIAKFYDVIKQVDSQDYKSSVSDRSSSVSFLLMRNLENKKRDMVLKIGWTHSSSESHTHASHAWYPQYRHHYGSSSYEAYALCLHSTEEWKLEFELPKRAYEIGKSLDIFWKAIGFDKPIGNWLFLEEERDPLYDSLNIPSFSQRMESYIQILKKGKEIPEILF